MNEFPRTELFNTLNKLFISKYDKMLWKESFANEIYSSWKGWADDVMAGAFGAKRKYENLDDIVYEDCLNKFYLVMSNQVFALMAFSIYAERYFYITKPTQQEDC